MTVERKFVKEAINKELIKEYLKRRVNKAGFGGAEIQRTLLGTRIALTVERPGLVIGKGGRLISALTDDLKNEFDLENPMIEVVEDVDPNLNPMIVASKLSNFIQRGWHFRRLGHNFSRNMMRAGAFGCQITFAGKLTGNRHRTEKFTEGHIKYCGDFADEWVKTGYSVAYTKPGTVGVLVRIMKRNTVEPHEPIFIEDTVETSVEAEVTEEPAKPEVADAEKKPKRRRRTKKKEVSDEGEGDKGDAQSGEDKSS